MRGVFADASHVRFHASCRVRCAFPWRAPMSGPGLRLPVSTSATVWTASTALGFSSFRLALHYSFIISCFAFLFIFLGPSSCHRFLVPCFFFFFRKPWGPRKSPGSVPSPRPRPTAVRHDRSPHGDGSVPPAPRVRAGLVTSRNEGGGAGDALSRRAEGSRVLGTRAPASPAFTLGSSRCALCG